MVTIERTTLLAGPIEHAFDLSLSVDAHLASMGASGERAVGGVTEGLIGLSEMVTWRARHFGVTWEMTNQIVQWKRPVWFVDEQVRGPFASFRHEHGFRDIDGRTQMADRVTFAAPFGVLGRCVERAFLARYMARLIDARNAFLADQMAGGGR